MSDLFSQQLEEARARQAQRYQQATGHGAAQQTAGSVAGDEELARRLQHGVLDDTESGVSLCK